MLFCLKQLIKLSNRIDKINQWRSEVMATIQDLKDAVVAEQAEVKARVDELEAQVLALQNSGAGGATPEQLDEVMVAIKGIFTPASVVVEEPVEPVVDPVEPTEPVDPSIPVDEGTQVL